MTISLLIATLIKWQRITWIKSSLLWFIKHAQLIYICYSLSFSLALLPCVFFMFKYPLVWKVKTCSLTTVSELHRNWFTIYNIPCKTCEHHIQIIKEIFHDNSILFFFSYPKTSSLHINNLKTNPRFPVRTFKPHYIYKHFSFPNENRWLITFQKFSSLFRK